MVVLQQPVEGTGKVVKHAGRKERDTGANIEVITPMHSQELPLRGLDWTMHG